MSQAHVSLNVSNLDKAVAFYQSFLGIAPARHEKDYAKFELADPPLVLSLEPVYHRGTDSFNHLGIRLADKDSVLASHLRLQSAGLVDACEEDVECCYSRQTKFWALDPDRNLWEVYALTGDLAHRGSLTASDALAARDRAGHPSAWEHRLGDPLVLPLTLTEESVDQVRLRGTFNTPRPNGESALLLQEALRILRPGGQIMIHGLVSDRPLPGGFPRLPGPAALVRHTPVETQPIRLLEEHGFVGTFAQKFGISPNFQHEGCKMRELLVCAWKPAAAASTAPAQVVVYKGPFREVTDDAGQVYRRGERVTVDPQTLQRLQLGPQADQFVFLRG
jgi:catechol 2,3-dioxygenase-like lactoylglutathione lyase family enzyme